MATFDGSGVQRRQALVRGRIGPDVELVEVEHGGQPLDRLPGDRYAGAAELTQRGRRDQSDQQPQNRDHHQDLEQGEPGLAAVRWSFRCCCLSMVFCYMVLREATRGDAAGIWIPIPAGRGRRLMAVPFLACMALVAQMYSLPPRVLPSIQAVEGGAPALSHLNRDGSEDLGVMQVNTLWIPRLVRYTGLDARNGPGPSAEPSASTSPLPG